MANVKGKLVADGSHNLLFEEAGVGVIPNLIVETVVSGENVRYKMAGVGEIPNAIVEFAV